MEHISLILFSLCTISFALEPASDYQKRSAGNGIGFIAENDVCHMPGTCQPLQASTSTCFGVKLSYTMTSPVLVNENFTQQQLQNDMSRWEGLRSSPKCWAVIQPLLCSYYFPKCQDDIIDLPPQELCKISKSKCRVIEQAMTQWPEFLHCNNLTKFPPNCKNEIRELRFPNTSTCLDPMKEVENPFNYYEGFEGCGLKCQDPFFSDEEHETASNWIWYLGIVTVLCNGCVVLTYLFEWMMTSTLPQYRDRIILYANAWYLIGSIGWLFQYLPLGKVDIVCRKDGTVRRNEITGTENIFCGLVSSWIYFSIMSVLAELMVFAYVWNLQFSKVGRVSIEVERRKAHFRVFAFCLPLIPTGFSLAFGKIGGSSMYGICFVGFYDIIPRILLVIVPIGLASICITFNLFRTARNLFNVIWFPNDYVGPAALGELKSAAYRFLIFPILMNVLLIAGLTFQIKTIRNQPAFDKSLRESFHCRMNLTNMAECGVSTEKPDILFVLGNIIIYFCGGLLVSSWAFTNSSLNVWKRRFCKSDESKSHRPRHRLITKAYAKRADFHANGRLELSLNSTYEDPVGLNKLLDPNHLGRNVDDVELHLKQDSQATGDGQDISSEWAAAIPNLTSRRGAMVPPSSNSVSCVSDDSRRPSYDSTMSEQYRGSNFGLNKIRSSRGFKGFKGKFKLRKNSNKGSSSMSLESNPGSQILPAITKLIDKKENMGDGNSFLHNTQGIRQQTKILKELAIQTSIEQLYSPSKGIKQCNLNLSNNLCVDQAIQCSLVKLNEIGTQTKKSATKKRDKNKSKKDPSMDDDHQEHGISTQTGPDEILKFLTPN